MNRRSAFLTLLTNNNTQPDDISGLDLWLDASLESSVTKDGSNKVSQWNDLSGKNNHLSQLTSANQPLFVANQINNRNIIRFDSTGDELLTAGKFVDLASFTIFVVFKASADSVWGSAEDIVSILTNSDNFFKIVAQADDVRFRYRSGASTAISEYVSVSGTNTYIFSATLQDSGNCYFYVDGVESASDSTNIAVTNSPSDISIYGAYSGDVAELLIYNRILTNSELQNIGKYLANKWQ